jgi:hypothetical protein
MKMKKYIITIAIIVFIQNFASAQISVPAASDVTITGGHEFIDASAYGSSGWRTNESKGLTFPQTDLKVWQFVTNLIGSSPTSTGFDGMIVYNTGTGSTLATTPLGLNGAEPTKADNGVVTSVSPGFYYFYNPTRYDSQLIPQPLPADTVEFGKWLPLGTGASGVVTVPVKNISATEIATSTSIDGKQVYA